ncbi:phosphopantetheine-binding protein [Dactylosporangium sp. CA-139066]|uniref:phosphopantetheine-binding protein n=1 Tax=Dactylosporangium sp. CA-139066 TaxID=3239930 RepID=UPI003D92CD6B
MTVDKLIAIYAEVLERPGIAADDDFFAAGGDSLLATRVLSAVYRAAGAELTFDDFLAAPTPAALSARLALGGRR